MIVSLNKKNHIYTVDGIVTPSVSDVLDVFFPPTPFYTEEGRDDGDFRHQWYAFLSQGNKPENAPGSRIADAIDGFKKFMADVKPEYVSGEISYSHPILKYCGTPDVVFKLNSRLAVVDYKPKTKNKRTQLQVALYFSLLRANNIMVQDRYELRCYDGIYRLDNHTNAEDMRRAEIMVAAFHAAQFYK